ncbi:MAG: ABC transporter permease [Deltaproteobacteria bacterium]|nr:ABC transporter permease [Deltaproteobacteria bacterium]
MIFKANIREAGRSLYGSKQRTLLALIGIVIGIGSVIAMVSIGKIVEEESLRQFKDMGTDILSIRKGYSKDGEDAAPRKITLEDALAVPRYCPSIHMVSPYVQSSLQTNYKGTSGFVPLLGVTEAFQDLNKIAVKSGRFVSDLDTFRHFCVLGAGEAGNLGALGLDQPLGQSLKAGDNIFTVIGVLEKVPMGGMRPYGINEGLMIPVSTASRAFPKLGITDIIARMKPGIGHVAAEKEIRAYFSDRLGGLNMEITSAEQLIAQMEKQMKLFTLLLGAVGSISLIVGGVGVMNIMLVSVTERRREIGIRRALGAKRRDIQGQFLIESIILSLVGGILGIAVGVAASYVVAHFNAWQFLISSMAILLGFGVSSAVGIFFGFYPAHQASRLDPIEALRSE